jgi:hypothetical protein
MNVSTKSLERKQADSYARIAQNVLGTSLTAAVPTPALELTKALAISLADAWMFYDIYRIYYDERLSSQRLQDLLGDAGVIIMTGGVISYGALKISQGMMSEFLNKIPIVGWLASGLLTGSSSLLLGLAWMAFIEGQYRQALELDKKQVKKPASTPQATTPEPAESQTEPEAPQSSADVLPDIELELDDDGKYLPQHPEGKRTLRVDGDKYQTIYQAFREIVTDSEQEYVLEDVTEAIESTLGKTFDGSIQWHVNVVKVDLEARGLIERIPNEQPQKIRLSL